MYIVPIHLFQIIRTDTFNCKGRTKQGKSLLGKA